MDFKQLVGIRLLPESYIPLSDNTEQLNSGKILGTVLITVKETTCSLLRECICKLIDSPKDYCFLNSAGWPIDVSLEDKIFISDCLKANVITIQKRHGKLSRIGIKLINGHILGFIYLSFSYEVSDIRNLIVSDLSDQFDSNETFEFVENNFWPVRRSQENSLSVWDLVVNNCITIKKKSLKRSLELDIHESDKRCFKRPNILENLNKEDEFNNQYIVISYVHREASTYARELKNELLKTGFKKIFLDTDDIRAGRDWQDELTSAVTNCSIFIPLVTPRYGETRWTNREAKLADDMEKIIIPISFLDKWPPDQLAIQFVTLQYIAWKTPDEVNGSNFSEHAESTWNQKSIQRVANEIKKYTSKVEISTPDSISLLDDASNFNTPHLRSRLRDEKERSCKGSKQKLIVISAHTKQKDFVHKVTNMLESEGYIVWCSVRMCDLDENSFSPIEDSQPPSSPMVESQSFSPVPFPFPEINGSTDHSSSSVKQLRREFREKVKQAQLVVLLLSEDYQRSRICWQQLFYCEHRKKAIVIKLGDFQIDCMILNLYPEHEMINMENWECLKFKIKDKLKFDSEDSYRSNIMLSVSKLKNVFDVDKAVYVFGGTDRISKNAEAFCMLLGTELAKVRNLNLATEGFYGVGDLVGKNFCEEQEIRYKGQPQTVFHIIPTSDSSDYSHKARQSSDNTFEKLPYGNTLFYGMSVSNRDDIVAAAFKLCILVEGGERSAYLAEKFLWNDCTVIPVLFNNSAFETKKCLKESIRKVPAGVYELDWLNLNKPNCSIEERAKSVKTIVCTLLNLQM